MQVFFQKVIKEHKGESNLDDEPEEDVEPPISPITREINVFNSFFSNVEVCISNQQIHNSNGLYAHKSHVSNNFKGAILEDEGALDCWWYYYEKFPNEIMETPLSQPFYTRRRKLLSIPLRCMINWGLISSPTLKCYVQT